MNDIEQTHQIDSPQGVSTQKRRTPRQRTDQTPEARSTTAGKQLASLDIHHQELKPKTITTLVFSSAPTTSIVVATPGAGNSNSLPGHQSGRSKQTNHRPFLENQISLLSDSLSSNNAGGDHDLKSSDNSPPSTLMRKKNLSTSDLDPTERKKQAALIKVEAKLEKAQRLHLKAHQSVEQEISDFLRITTIPHTTPTLHTTTAEASSSRSTNATFDKRIKTLQETKKELEKKIAHYQSDISRIHSGDIPTNYTLSKDLFNNIRSTAVKVASGSLKHRPSTHNDQTITVSTPNTNEQLLPFHYPESDNYYHNSNLPPTLITPASTSHNTGSANNNQNLLSQSHNSNTLEAIHSSLSSSMSNEIGNSQFYIDSSHEHVYDGDKSSRKYDANVPADTLAVHDFDKSPTTKRRLTDDSNIELNDRTSDYSADDRLPSTNTSKRNTSTATTEYHQLNLKIDSMQKLIDRYDTKLSEMQKQIDTLILISDTQNDETERLNNEITDLTDLHQLEMSSMKTDLKNLEDRLLYKFSDYWNELLEKLDKLDTRTAKVEQTQTHSNETEENTHRIISKLVNILLTVFAIILLLLSTIKNLVQSRVHAMTLLILALAWLTFHYLPPSYFQTSFLKNVPTIFKRST